MLATVSGAIRHRPSQRRSLRTAWEAPMWRLACAVAAAVALAAIVAAPAARAAPAAWLSKRAARAVAVDAAARTCRAVGWCTRPEVVPARRCRRAKDRTVYCAIAFVTADARRCGGVVAVSRTRKGRVERGMAVPADCSAAAEPAVGVSSAG
jgi:hypothetical protein